MTKSREFKPWFQSDHFLWGWYPVSWQGWFVLLCYLGIILYSSWVLLPRYRLEKVAPEQFLTWLLILIVCFLSLLLVVWTTGGRPLKADEDEKKRQKDK